MKEKYNASNVYFKNAVEACENGSALYGNITDIEALKRSMEANCIPADIVDMDYTSYLDFLVARRQLMALKIKAYYEQL